MITLLSNTDCVDILEYYGIPIPENKNMIKILAEKIISKQLCKCIHSPSCKSNQKTKKRRRVYI